MRQDGEAWLCLKRENFWGGDQTVLATDSFGAPKPATRMSARGRKHQLDAFSSGRSLHIDGACGGPTVYTAASPSTAVIADGKSAGEVMTASGPEA